MSKDIEINELKVKFTKNIISGIGNLNRLLEAKDSIKRERGILNVLKFTFAFNGFSNDLSKTSNNISKLLSAKVKENPIPEVTALQEVICSQSNFGGQFNNPVHLKMLGIIK